MTKFTKMTTIAVVISLVLAFSAMAQESNTHVATAGVYGTDVDDYMNYHNYSDVEFNKWFGFAGWNGALNLGYATRFGGIYMGLLYDGLGVEQNSAKRTEIIDPTYFNADGSLNQVVTTLEYDDRGFSTYNGITALIGIAGMGIKVGFHEYTSTYDEPSGITFTETKIGDTTVTYTENVDSYTEYNYNFYPSLGWGMKFDLGSMVLKPFADVELGIYSDKYELIYSDYTTVHGEVSGTKTTTSHGNVGGFLYPDITAGIKLGIGKMELGLKYNIGIDIYSANSYDAFGISGDVKGRAQWNNAARTITSGGYSTTTADDVTVYLSEMSGMYHKIVPSFYYDWDLADRVKLGFYGEVPISFSKSSEDSYNVRTQITDVRVPTDSAASYTRTVTTRNYGGLAETSAFGISPNIGLGAQAVLVPDRFALNVGIGLTPVSYSKMTMHTSRNGHNTVYTREVNASGDVTVDTVTTNLNTGTVSDELVETNSWSYMEAGVGAGFILNFTPKFALDTAFYWKAGFDVDITQMNILFTIKN